jgi:cell shape-determining protein MreC
MLKLILIISIILLVIILLSAINVCSMQVYYNRFIDRYYSYISEPFNSPVNTLNTFEKSIINVNNSYLTNSMNRMSKVKMNEEKINNIKDAISALEMKLKSVSPQLI